MLTDNGYRRSKSTLTAVRVEPMCGRGWGGDSQAPGGQGCDRRTAARVVKIARHGRVGKHLTFDIDLSLGRSLIRLSPTCWLLIDSKVPEQMKTAYMIPDETFSASQVR